MRNALGRAPEVGHQVAIGEKDATGFAETDEHLLGKEVRVVGITQCRLRPGVEDHGLVVGIEVRQVLRQSDVYALRLVPEVVDRRNPPVGEGDGRTDLTPKVGGFGLPPRAPLVFRDSPMVVQVLGRAVLVGPESACISGRPA